MYLTPYPCFPKEPTHVDNPLSDFFSSFSGMIGGRAYVHYADPGRLTTPNRVKSQHKMLRVVDPP